MPLAMLLRLLRSDYAQTLVLYTSLYSALPSPRQDKIPTQLHDRTGTACLKTVLSASTIISFISLASSSELRKADRGNMSYSLNSFKGDYIGALIGLIRGILGI